MPDSILTIRIHAGFNASSFTAGLLALTEQTSGTAGAYLRSLFPGLDIGLELKPAWVRGISGWTVKFLTPAETGHGHRHPEEIEAIYAASRLSAGARQRARAVWHELVRAEARVHGTSENEVHFHEVGRLSNILAVGLCAQFLETLELGLLRSRLYGSLDDPWLRTDTEKTRLTLDEDRVIQAIRCDPKLNQGLGDGFILGFG